MIRVLVLGGNDYEAIFVNEGYALGSRHDYDVVCFSGGTDISPALYGASRNRHTDSPDTARDVFEADIFSECLAAGKPMVGICRGAQLLCALSGGSLYQHVTGHNGSHNAYVRRIGEEVYDDIIVTSSHHQMMDVSLVEDAVLLGYTESRGVSYEPAKGSLTASEVGGYDTEVVYFPKTRALAHQPHPEWMNSGAPYYKYFFNTFEDLLEGK